MEVSDNCPADVVEFLLRRFGLAPADLYEVNGLINLTRPFTLATNIARLSLALKKSQILVEAVARYGLLLLHSYESFTPIVDLVQQAAKDTVVLTIKTLAWALSRQLADGREAQLDAGAMAAGTSLQTQLGMMAIGDLTHDGQSQAAAFRRRIRHPIEALEHALA